jgi:spermidine/putrescine-binding protein
VQGVSNGEFVLGTTLSGRAAVAINSGQPVRMVWNGAILHNSWTFILKGSPHPRAAEALLLYMQRADRQAELAKLTGYSGGNKNATKGLDPKVVEMLPATQEHLAVASMVDAAWWAENNAKVTARWDAWMAQH